MSKKELLYPLHKDSSDEGSRDHRLKLVLSSSVKIPSSACVRGSPSFFCLYSMYLLPLNVAYVFDKQKISLTTDHLFHGTHPSSAVLRNINCGRLNYEYSFNFCTKSHVKQRNLGCERRIVLTFQGPKRDKTRLKV